VRIIWGTGRSFPTSNVTSVTTVVSVVAAAGFKSLTIGGASYTLRSTNEVSSPRILRQNHVPKITASTAFDTRRLTLERKRMYQNALIPGITYTTSTLVTGASTTSKVSSGTVATKFITSSSSATSVTVVDNPFNTGTFIYGTSLISTNVWGFRIYNLSTMTVASLSSGTYITINTTASGTGSVGNNTVYVYTLTDTTSIIALTTSGSVAPTDGIIYGISLPGGSYSIPSPASVTADFLVVGGGGSGGNSNTTNANGGGGGGGVLYATGVSLVGRLAITVGAGGAAIGNATIGNGNPGGYSAIGSYIAQGGGGGGSTGVAPAVANMAGGSGGGAAYGQATAINTSTQTTIGSATGYGFAGGGSGVTYTGAGGGGAGGAGVAGSSTAPGGNGGAGRAFNISGTWQWYAGGGGGGGNSSERAGDGYAGGGRGEGTTTQYAYNNYPADGTVNAVTTGSATPNAIPNTGGGGGAGSYWAANGGWSSGSGKGGSGIVIIRYSGSQQATGGTVTTASGYTIHTFTATGSTTFTPFGVVDPTALPKKSIVNLRQTASYTRVPVYASTITDYNVATLTNVASLTGGDISAARITSVLGSNPWTITIDQLRSTVNFTTGTIVQATPQGGTLGIGNTVYVTAVNSSTSLTCIAKYGTVAPTTGTIVGVYSRGTYLGPYIQSITPTFVLPNTTSYSVRFDPTQTTYLEYGQSTAFNLAGAGTSWTAECWVRPNGDYAGYNTIFCKRTSGSSTTSYEGYLRQTSGVISFYNGTNYESTYTLTPGVWSHCAWVYIGNTSTLNIYVNGILVYTTTLSLGADNAQSLVIGNARGYSEYFSGYLSNFRLVKGVPVYTGNFTPPTLPLETTQVSGTNIAPISTGTYTVLLTCQTTSFIDRSLYNTSTTITGSPTTSTVSPFFTATAVAPYTFNINGLTSTNAFVNGAYITATSVTGSIGTGSVFVYSINNAEQITCISTSTAPTLGTIDNVTTSSGNYYGGTARSQYQVGFNQSNQYVTVAATSALEFGANNFTIEFWWYPTSTARQALYHGSLGADWSVGIDYSSIGTQKIGIWASSNGSSWNLINSDAGGNGTGSVTPTQNTWNHVAYVRNGTTWQLYVNGVLSVNVTGLSGTIVTRNTYPKVIGMWFNSTSYPVSGYISNFRIVTNTALYTSAFSLPTGEATTVTNTALLTLKSPSFVDLSSNALTVSGVNSPVITLGSLNLLPAAQVYQYQAVLNSSPPTSGGGGVYLTTPSTANYAFNADFTVECWVYVTSNGTNVILTLGTGGSSTYIGWQINSDRSITWETNPSANWNWPYIYTSSAGVIPLTTWTHIAAVRYGTNFSMYVNGSSVYSTTSYQAAGSGGTLYIGTYYANYNNDGSYFRGNISNFRMVKGTAVYTGAFTTPTSELLNITNTVLLTFKSSSFLDLSSNAVTITPVNSPTMSVSTLPLTSITSPVVLGPTANYTSLSSGTVYNIGFGSKLGPAATVVTNLSTNTETPSILHYNWANLPAYGNEVLFKVEVNNNPYNDNNSNNVGDMVTQPVLVYTRDTTVNYGKTRWVIPDSTSAWGGAQAATAVTEGSMVPAGYANTGSAKIVTSSTRTTLRVNVPVGIDSGGVGTITNVVGSGPWTFDITGLTTTTGFVSRQILSATPRVGSFGTGTVVYIVLVNTSTYSVTCSAYGGTTPTAGLVNSVYPTGEIDPDPTISAITTVTTTSWVITVTGLKGTTGYTTVGSTGTLVTVTTSSVTGGSAGAGNVVVVSAINNISQITCYVTGTSIPVAGVISGVVPTGSTGNYPAVGEIAYTTTGTYSWTAPTGVTLVNVVAVGGGGGGSYTWSGGGGGAGGLGWRNNIPVVPGQIYTVVVGAGGPPSPNASNVGAIGGNSYFISTGTVAGYGSGRGGPNATAYGASYGGGYYGDGGGRGGNGNNAQFGGAGAGGYAGAGADSGANAGTSPVTGSGGGASGGYYSSTYGTPGGGGVGIYGKGADGTPSGAYEGGGGGSGGGQGVGGQSGTGNGSQIINGGAFGGGGGGSGTSWGGGWGGVGAVRIMWGAGRAFPATFAGTYTAVVALATATTKSTTIGGQAYGYKSPTVTVRMKYPKSVGIDRLDTIVTIDTINRDAAKIKLYAFNNLSSYTAGSKSVTNSLTGSENFYVAGTGTDGATSLSAYWM
jgi:hypothetical protein